MAIIPLPCIPTGLPASPRASQAPARAAYDALLAAGFVVAWSSGFIGATLGTRAASVETLLMWRFVIAAPLLVLWTARRSVRPLGRRALALHSVLGLLSQGVYLGGIVSAVAVGVGAGVAALIAALQPIAAAALAGPILGEQVLRPQWLGLVAGLGGVAVVVAGDLAGDHAAPAWAYALPFAGMAGLVAATLLERRTAPGGTEHVRIAWFSTASMRASAPPLLANDSRKDVNRACQS